MPIYASSNCSRDNLSVGSGWNMPVGYSTARLNMENIFKKDGRKHEDFPARASAIEIVTEEK
jgi:hypothetical protein